MPSTEDNSVGKDTENKSNMPSTERKSATDVAEKTSFFAKAFNSLSLADEVTEAPPTPRSSKQSLNLASLSDEELEERPVPITRKTPTETIESIKASAHPNALKIVEDIEQFRKLKKDLQAKKVITHKGVKQVLPKAMDNRVADMKRLKKIRRASRRASAKLKKQTWANAWSRMNKIPLFTPFQNRLAENEEEPKECAGTKMWEKKPIICRQDTLAGRRTSTWISPRA
mmetsp:Transcript_55204/g.66463  ORF Transcript_55204/g.66463 Transcript_55204/m.66463 type:complete len:228 (-) Transcript_55204:183-866(-)|eukprot:CAMPEP_0172504278 /NCGR_PEP_ID=MMETSP1066-20121228/177123_1 /TAXON_ID=671091 /ORGANISM="Coscinodiscus wailesii, Strain CCMP2513" /LENGTH=227 /DNA_ID=CAMNT_0013280381 /DNA_START=142 /DNA_END=825 /DNA_ORIENTATION=-